MEPLSIVLICLCVTFILFYGYSRKNLSYWKIRNVPYPKPLPVVGNAFPVISQKLSIGDFLSDMYNTTNHPFLGIYFLETPYLLIRDHKVLKEALISNVEHFTDRFVLLDTKDEFARHLLFILPASESKDLRAKITPLFSSGKLKAMQPLISEVGDRLIDYLDRNIIDQRIDCRAAATRYGMDLVASCAFGLDGGCLTQKNSEFFKMCIKFFDYTDVFRAIQMVSQFTLPSVARLLRMKFLDPTASKFMHKVVMDTLKERIENKYNRGDLIDILQKMQEQDKTYASEPKKLSVVAIQFLIGGYESSAGAVTFMLYELSKNQEIQKKLRDEANRVYEKYKEFSYEAINEMQYLEMVLKETLRKYPLLPFLERRCIKPYKIPNTDLVIEKGVGIYGSIYGFHHDPENFPNPQKFDPERFSSENKASIPVGAYIPFGSGIRNCIGARLANLTIKTGVVKIIHNYQIDKSFDTPDPIELASNWLFIAPKSKQFYLNFKKITTHQ